MPGKRNPNREYSFNCNMLSVFSYSWYLQFHSNRRFRLHRLLLRRDRLELHIDQRDGDRTFSIRLLHRRQSVQSHDHDWLVNHFNTHINWFQRLLWQRLSLSISPGGSYSLNQSSECQFGVRRHSDIRTDDYNNKLNAHRILQCYGNRHEWVSNTLDPRYDERCQPGLYHFRESDLPGDSPRFRTADRP